MPILIIVTSLASSIIFIKLIRVLLSKIFEGKYESSLKKGNPIKAVFWGRLYYYCLSAIDRKMEGIKDINAAISRDIQRNLFIRTKNKHVRFDV